MIDYNKPSMQLALDMINSAAGTQYRLKDITLMDIQYEEEGFYNTSATVTPVEGSGYQDPHRIQYDRINMDIFFKGIPVTVVPAYQKLLSDYLPSINKAYGLSLDASDIIDGVIPSNTNPPFKIDIQINPYNPAFYGKFTLLVSDARKSIKLMVDTIDFGGIPYPTLDKTKIQGPLYFYGEDWTGLANMFKLYNTGDKVDMSLLTQINLYSEDVWVLSTSPIQFNLYNAKVLYNERYDKTNVYTKKVGFENVLVIGLDEEYCTNVAGYLVFHYNTVDDLV